MTHSTCHFRLGLLVLQGLVGFAALAPGFNMVIAQSVRHYIFDRDASPSQEVVSLGTQKEPLRLADDKPLELYPGRRDGSQLFILDDQAFTAAPFDASSGFTIEVVFRYLGQGSQLGNGRSNGMVFAQGDGYWHGLRLYCETTTGQLRFEMGRPQPRNAFGITSRSNIPKNIWQYVAITWDQKQLRMYVNGVLTASAEYAGPYTPPNGPLRLGFANAGVGSLKLQIAEWRAHNACLSADQIAWQAVSAVPGPLSDLAAEPAEEWRAAWNDATERAAASQWREAGNLWSSLASQPQTPGSIRHLALYAAGIAQALRAATTDAVQTWARLAMDPSAPVLVRENAAGACVVSRRGVIGAVAPLEIYEQLLASGTWPESERQNLILLAAEAALSRGESDRARKYFAQVMQLASATGDLAWDLRLRVGHAYRAAQAWNDARDIYRAIAEDPQAPMPVRGVAWLAWASTYERAGQWQEAATAYRQVAARADIHPVHRWEADDLALEMDRVVRGLPRRDPQRHRTPPPQLAQGEVEIHVAPQGNDSNPGTSQAPLATLGAARDRIRQIKQSRGLPAGGVTVWVHGGVYTLRQTLELTEQDSGRPDAPITYRAAEGSQPVWTGGVELVDFQPVQDARIRNRLPEAARDKVVQVDLRSYGVQDLGSLGVRGFGQAGYPTHPWVDCYFNDQPGTLARWPNDGFVQIKGLTSPAGDAGRTQPGTWRVEGNPLTWAADDDIWMFGYWRYLWAGLTVRVKSIDRDAGQLTTAGTSNYGFAEGMPYYFFNVLEELDQPGEWYLDRKSGILYFYPPADLKTLRVKMPVLAAPFIHTKNTSHVRFVGLTFECGRAEGVVIEGGQDVALLGCRILRLGTNGVVILGGTGHIVMGCDIATVGAGGIRLAGGDIRTLTPSGHVVENCHIWDFTRVDRNYAPAVQVDGVGSIIRHNLFHDSPHHGMRVEGFDHLIELNEVHSVVYESDDQSGIDMFGDPSYRGNIIRWNYWHHIGSGHDVAGQAGIRLDDMISGVVVYGNVFYKAAGGQFGGVQIHGGKDNWVDNNLFISCKAAVSFSAWSPARWLESVRNWLENAKKRGLDVTKSPFADKYPDLRNLEENPNRNFVLRSLVVDCGEFAIRDPGVNVFVDNHLAQEDIGFEDAGQRDFRLKSDSAIYNRSSFRAIPFDEIGLYESPYRASWPVSHSVTPKYVEE